MTERERERARERMDAKQADKLKKVSKLSRWLWSVKGP